MPMTPPGEAEGFALAERHEAPEILSLHSADSTSPIDEYELTPFLTTSSLTSLLPAYADRALAAMIFDPTATPAVPDRASSSSFVVVDKEDAEGEEPPLLLSTERTEELIEIEGEGTPEPPTQYTVAELLNEIVERGIELPDTDEEEEFEVGREGVGMGGLGEDEVLREIEMWERRRGKQSQEAEAESWEGEEVEEGDSEGEVSLEERGGESESLTAAAKGKGQAVDDDDNSTPAAATTAAANEQHSPTSTYSHDEHGTPAPPHPQPPQEKKKKRKHRRATTTTTATFPLSTTPIPSPFPPETTPSSSPCTHTALKALSHHLAMGEHVVDTKKVMREAEEAEARGESFDVVSRIKELQNGSARDCGPLVDGLEGWLRGGRRARRD